MRNKLKAEQVFRPGSFPEHTYISRISEDTGFDYEIRLRQALSTSGFMTSIVGPSKIGKTVLCEKVVGKDNLVEVTGADCISKEGFWNMLGTKAELPSTSAVTNTYNQSPTGTTLVNENFSLTKEAVIRYYVENKKVLLLDDFHYVSEDMQIFIAQQLKDAIRKDFKVIIASLPHRADDTIRRNPDLQGRLSLINLTSWKSDELEEIAMRGFNSLGIPIARETANYIANESLTSPQLMQQICLSICLILDADNNDITEIKKDVIQKAFVLATINYEYKEIANTIKQGPSTRGKQRKIFDVQGNLKLNLYELIVLAISLDPPITAFKFSELFRRVNNLITCDDKPNSTKMREYLGKLQTYLDTKASSYQVIEWKDSQLYVLDPLFLFWLRWGKRND